MFEVAVSFINCRTAHSVCRRNPSRLDHVVDVYSVAGFSMCCASRTSFSSLSMLQSLSESLDASNLFILLIHHF
jgi:hypothetical protein